MRSTARRSSNDDKVARSGNQCEAFPFAEDLFNRIATTAETIVLDATLADYRKEFGGAAIIPPAAPITSMPGESLHIVHMLGGDILTTKAAWGFVPQWRKHADDPVSYAAGATLARNWMFSVAFRNWRCIVPATSISYLKVVDGVRMLYELTPTGGGLMLLGAIYQPNSHPGAASSTTVALVTTGANRMLAPHGLQVPLLLKHKQVTPWLRSRTNIDLVKSFLQPPGDERLRLNIRLETLHSIPNPIQASLEFA